MLLVYNSIWVCVVNHADITTLGDGSNKVAVDDIFGITGTKDPLHEK